MLAPNFENDKDKKAAGLEWISFCQGFRLTAPEIVEAYTMALKKELKIFDENKAYKSSEYEGEYIKVYPNLSLITAGEILKAYIEHKRIDKQWEIGKKTIEKYLNAPPEITLEHKKEQRMRLWESLKSSVSENKHCSHAFLFYEALVKKGYFKNFVGNEAAQTIVIKNKMHKIILAEAEKKKTIFSRNEIFHLKIFCTSKDYQMPDVVDFGFNKLKGMAIVEVKNDLVYNHVKKQLKKITNETGNEMSDSNISEEQK